MSATGRGLKGLLGYAFRYKNLYGGGGHAPELLRVPTQFGFTQAGPTYSVVPTTPYTNQAGFTAWSATFFGSNRIGELSSYPFRYRSLMGGGSHTSAPFRPKSVAGFTLAGVTGKALLPAVIPYTNNAASAWANAFFPPLFGANSVNPTWIPNWVPFKLAAYTKALKYIGGGNRQQNYAFLKALAIAEATTNQIWAQYQALGVVGTTHGLRVQIKLVPRIAVGSAAAQTLTIDAGGTVLTDDAGTNVLLAG
jgi:hypothetical protein